MVKDFIKGVFKKKDKSQESNPEPSNVGNVPDELPPLAEDVIKKPSTEKSQPETTFSEEKYPTTFKESPEELPPISAAPSEDASESKNREMPHESDIAELAESKEDEVNELPGKDMEPSDRKIKGFFANLLKHLQHEGTTKHKILSGDLFSRMNNYWELRKDEIKTGTSLSNREKLEQELIKEITQLQLLENKWQIQKMALDEDLRFLHEREKDIQLKVVELKKLTNELKLFNDVAPEHYFHMHNGVVIKNLHELIDALEIIDEDTFKHHVNAPMDDFAGWIRNVIKDTNLADKVSKIKTREEMITLLETEPVQVEEIVSKRAKPKDYFWLKNGVVIKDLYELSDALRVMDDDTFNYHVNAQKNDFSVWLAHSLNSKYLAEKVSPIKSRQEIIDLLEVFL